MGKAVTIPRWILAVILGALIILGALLIISVWHEPPPPELPTTTSGAEAQATIDAAIDEAETAGQEAADVINGAETDEEYRDACLDVGMQWWDE